MHKSPMTDTSGVQSAIEHAVHQLGYASLKSEQLNVVVGIIEGRDILQCYQLGTGRASALSVCL